MRVSVAIKVRAWCVYLALKRAQSKRTLQTIQQAEQTRTALPSTHPALNAWQNVRQIKKNWVKNKHENITNHYHLYQNVASCTHRSEKTMFNERFCCVCMCRFFVGFVHDIPCRSAFMCVCDFLFVCFAKYRENRNPSP